MDAQRTEGGVHRAALVVGGALQQHTIGSNSTPSAREKYLHSADACNDPPEHVSPQRITMMREPAKRLVHWNVRVESVPAGRRHIWWSATIGRDFVATDECATPH